MFFCFVLTENFAKCEPGKVFWTESTNNIEGMVMASKKHTEFQIPQLNTIFQ